MHMNLWSGKSLSTWLGLLLAAVSTAGTLAQAQSTNPIPTLQIKADQVTAKVSPMLYGLMTEEINYSYEGGLYGELIRNRTFKANPTNAVFWSVIGDGPMSLDTNQPLNAALNVSLKLDTSKAVKKLSRRHRQRRVLGHSRSTEYDLPVIVLCPGEAFQRSADRRPR